MSWPASPRTRMRPFGPGSPIAGSSAAARELGRRAVGEVGPVALAGVDDQHPGGARGGEHGCERLDDRARAGETSLPSSSPKPPGSRKSRCMSMMSSAVRPARANGIRLSGDAAAARVDPLGRCVEVHQVPLLGAAAVYSRRTSAARWLDAIARPVRAYSGPCVPICAARSSTRGPRSRRRTPARRLAAMHTPLYADPARRARSPPPARACVDVVPAREVVPHLAAGGVMPRRPADRVRSAMCTPMRAALGVALAIEGVGADPAAALALADAGELDLLPNHDVGGVGPMSGVVTGSMPVLVARDEASGHARRGARSTRARARCCATAPTAPRWSTRLRVDARRARPGARRARSRAPARST